MSASASEKGAPGEKTKHGGWSHLTHHLRAALIVGAIVTLLHSIGALGWLDAVMLNAAGAVQRGGSDASTGPLPDDMPLVLTFSPAVYETAFQQTSPLDRTLLAKWLDHVPVAPREVPRQVVFDLDLSPIKANADDPLDASLLRLADSGAEVVLALPLRVVSNDLLQTKILWARRLCREGRGRVAFGLTEIDSYFGRVVQYDPRQLSLGVVAAQHGPRHIASPEATAAHGSAAETAPPSLCTMLLDDAGARLLLSGAFNNQGVPLRPASAHLPLFRPFNAKFFTQGDRAVAAVGALDPRPTLADGSDLQWAGRSVFIGGAFDSRDYFAMPLESGANQQVEGVLVHAAVYYSEHKPVESLTWMALFIDVCAGVVAAFLFQWSWQYYNRLSEKTHGTPWRHYVAVRAGALLNVAVLGALMLLALALAYHCLYPQNIWVNPGPIMLGMFTKFVIAGVHDPHGSEADAHPSPWPGWIEAGLLMAAAIVALHVLH